jgi:hypothetical protein
VLSGLLQVFTQMQLARARFDQERGVTQKVHFDRDAFKIQTAYPSMAMICIGALLLLVETFFTK